MQLDQTHVAIRLRTLSEIGDLSMIMVRRYPESLLIGFSLGAIVWAAANLLLLGWIPWQEASYGLDDEAAVAEISRYMVWMTLLVILQTPAAGVFTTLYLGQAVFEKRPTWKSVSREVSRQFRRWIWILGIKRLALPTMILLAFRWGQPLSGLWDIFVPIVILLMIVILRSGRPFAPEILLLEQCPLRSKSDSEITLARRSKSLHSPMSSELSGRFLAISLLLCGLFLSCLYTMIWFRGIILGYWNFLNLTVLLVFFPLSLWCVAGISVIMRILNYLDTRIRLEGWEVELSVRAEALRQFGSDEQINTAATAVTPQKKRTHSESAKLAQTSGAIR